MTSVKKKEKKARRGQDVQRGNKPSGISEKGNKENAFPFSLANVVL